MMYQHFCLSDKGRIAKECQLFKGAVVSSIFPIMLTHCLRVKTNGNFTIQLNINN